MFRYLFVLFAITTFSAVATAAPIPEIGIGAVQIGARAPIPSKHVSELPARAITYDPKSEPVLRRGSIIEEIRKKLEQLEGGNTARSLHDESAELVLRGSIIEEIRKKLEQLEGGKTARSLHDESVELVLRGSIIEEIRKKLEQLEGGNSARSLHDEGLEKGAFIATSEK
ncbi:hypothetical protein D9613_000130 [Agrocybe pediades]|uniref:Uncharacterized protein n=1 Tax=Agrocybe pediades TaxID=84607 RepID=A0A8H4QZ61_9AGAR|nr:hypothetical protein D9613_000130 [Agrocybe pediades]